jgi:hypothetical protein
MSAAADVILPHTRLRDFEFGFPLSAHQLWKSENGSLGCRCAFNIRSSAAGDTHRMCRKTTLFFKSAGE